MTSGEHVGTVIVGGGIAGVSLAYFLAVNGVSDVLLLERGQLGCGATGGSFGGIRQQFSTRLGVELSKRGLEFWKSIESRLGCTCPFHQDGYLYVTGRSRLLESLARAADLQ